MEIFSMANLLHLPWLIIYEGENRQLLRDYVQLLKAKNGASALFAAALNNEITLIRIDELTDPWPEAKVKVAQNPPVVIFSDCSIANPTGRQPDDWVSANKAKVWCQALFICAKAGDTDAYAAIVKIATLPFRTVIVQTTPERAIAWRSFMQCKRVTVIWPEHLELPR
jgi:hypothetical protein